MLDPTTPAAPPALSPANDELEAVLRAALPPLLQPQAAEFAQKLRNLLSSGFSEQKVGERIASDPVVAAVVRELDGKKFEDGGSVIKVEGGQITTLSVGQAAQKIINIDFKIVFDLATWGFSPGATPRFRTHITRLVEDYNLLFGGRDAELKRLDAFLDDPKRPFALIYEPLGRGKTALLVRWAFRVQAAKSWSVILAPINSEYSTASAVAVLGLIAQGLFDFWKAAGVLLKSPPSPVAQVDEFKAYIVRALSPDLTARDRSILLILDGVDEAATWKVDRLLFPGGPVNKGLKIVASSSSGANRTREDLLKQLGWDDEGSIQGVKVDRLTRADVESILRQAKLPAVSEDAWSSLVDDLERVGEGEPLTVKLVVQALKDGKLTHVDLTKLKPGLTAAMRVWLDELERGGKESESTKELLGLCATAVGLLTEEYLRHLDETRFATREQLSDAVKPVSRFLVGDAGQEVGYGFAHPQLGKVYAQEQLSKADVDGFRKRFVKDGQDWFGRSDDSVPHEYVRRYWVVHLSQLDDQEHWDQIRDVLTGFRMSGRRMTQRWAAARFAAEATYAGFLSDLDRLFDHALKTDDRALTLRCALISGSLRSLSALTPVELVTGLMRDGAEGVRWDAAAALEHVRLIPEPRKKVHIFRSLLVSVKEFPGSLALAFVAGLDEQTQVAALRALAATPVLDVSLLPTALSVARRFSDTGLRVKALAALAPRSDEALDRLREEGAAKTIGALMDLLPRLSEQNRVAVAGELFDAARKLTDARESSRVLMRVARWLAAERLGEALQAAGRLKDSALAANVLAALAHRLPPTLDTEALAIARGLEGPRHKFLALAGAASVCGQIAP